METKTTAQPPLFPRPALIACYGVGLSFAAVIAYYAWQGDITMPSRYGKPTMLHGWLSWLLLAFPASLTLRRYVLHDPVCPQDDRRRQVYGRAALACGAPLIMAVLLLKLFTHAI